MEPGRTTHGNPKVTLRISSMGLDLKVNLTIQKLRQCVPTSENLSSIVDNLLSVVFSGIAAVFRAVDDSRRGGPDQNVQCTADPERGLTLYILSLASTSVPFTLFEGSAAGECGGAKKSRLYSSPHRSNLMVLNHHGLYSQRLRDNILNDFAMAHCP